jgi:hypothetical protein
MGKFVFADEMLHAGKFCATIARALAADFHRRRFIPRPTDDTATVSFVKFDGKTYAVTARHVIERFAAQAAAEGIERTSAISCRPRRAWSCTRRSFAAGAVARQRPRHCSAADRR